MGLVWTAAGEMGRMHELSPRHIDAIVVLAAAQCGHALEVDHRAHGHCAGRSVALDDRPQLFQDLVGGLGLALAIQEGGLESERDRSVAGQFQIGELAIDGLDPAIAQAIPSLADLLQGGVGLPRLQDEADGAEPAAIQLPTGMAGIVSPRQMGWLARRQASTLRRLKKGMGWGDRRQAASVGFRTISTRRPPATSRRKS